MQTRWFFIYCQGFCAWFVWLDPEFQFMATKIMSMATRCSDLEDWRSGANLQTEGHMGMESQHWQGPEGTGALGSSPSHLPSWSPARGLPPNHPNTRYCLGIYVTLTEETGAVPPSSHTWTAPLVEDMLCYTGTGFTKAVVTGPGGHAIFMGDILWERASVQMSLGMLHSCLQGWAHGLVNQPISLQTP